MRVISCLALIVVAAVLAGCGGDDEEPARPPATPAAEGSLELVFRRDDGATPRRLTFRCPGPDCRLLERINREAIEPTPADVACTEIYGGPQTARLTGTLDGRRIDARFARSNGCEIHRWDLVIGVLAPDLPVGAAPAPVS
jgi:hypothetical protein